MIQLAASPEAARIHTQAVMNCVRKRYHEASVRAAVNAVGAETIEQFLLAPPDVLRRWAHTAADKLRFSCFREIYSKYFSNGDGNFVDADYNAYKYLELMGVTVCPYCDDEYLDRVTVGEKTRRTSEIDHFFPKSEYPALAMCFYNLVPSGQSCNGLKLDTELGMNPHEHGIEDATYLYPDLRVGISLEAVDPQSCVVKFHPKDGMEANVETLALEQRYVRHAPEAHRLLLNLQRYSEEKIDELVRMGFGTREEILSNLFGPQDETEKRNSLRQKMLRDLTGY